MRSLGQLVKRNCLVYVRDRSAVFYSLMSMMIVVLLMVVFLGDMNIDNIVSILGEYGGIRDTKLDREHAKALIQLWTLAGILVVNSVTVTLAVIGTMVNDREMYRLQSFYTAPISKGKVATGYILSAVIIGTIECVVTFLFAIVYVTATSQTMISVKACILILCNIILNVWVFSIIMYFIASVVQSSRAWASIGTIVGTLVGFVGAIYLPMGALPEGVGNVLKAIPILHGTAIMRDILCEEALTTTFTNIDPEIIAAFREEMGIDIVVNEKVVSSAFQYCFIAACGIIILAIILLRARNERAKDR